MSAPLKSIQLVCRQHRALRHLVLQQPVSALSHLTVQKPEHVLAAPPAVQLMSVRHMKQKRVKTATESNLDDDKWVSRKRDKVTQEKGPSKEEDAELMSRVPQDDVWFRKYYPDPRLSFLAAVEQLREFAVPEMSDNMHGIIKLTLQLDMKTKKKTKFLPNVKSTVILPHRFTEGAEKRVVALCRSPEDQERAKEAGAMFVGSIDMVNMLDRGDVHVEDFDIIVCTTDFVPELRPIRKSMRSRLPNARQGSVGDDIEEVVARFVKGKSFESTKDVEEVGYLSVEIGRLDMSDAELVANLKAYLIAICNYHKRTESLGEFLTRGHLSCAPSTDIVLLDPEELKNPEPLVRAQGRKKGKKEDVESEIEDPENADLDEAVAM